MRTTSTALATAQPLMLLGAAAGASAQDTLKLAVGQRGNWDTSVSEVGQRAGIFKKHGLVLEILYTQGARRNAAGGDLRQRRLGIAAGIMGVLQRLSRKARRCASSAPRRPARRTSTGT